jgi:hypothetical protein
MEQSVLLSDFLLASRQSFRSSRVQSITYSTGISCMILISRDIKFYILIRFSNHSPFRSFFSPLHLLHLLHLIFVSLLHLRILFHLHFVCDFLFGPLFSFPTVLHHHTHHNVKMHLQVYYAPISLLFLAIPTLAAPVAVPGSEYITREILFCAFRTDISIVSRPSSINRLSRLGVFLKFLKRKTTLSYYSKLTMLLEGQK